MAALLWLQMLEDLSIKLMTNGAAQAFWRAVFHFPQLRRLSLSCSIHLKLQPDEGMLRMLPPTLQHLSFCQWERVHLQGEGLLPGLTHLRVRACGILVVDACLPSLVDLRLLPGLTNFPGVQTVRLQGEQLQLPQLASMRLDCRKLQVDFGRIPRLSELEVAAAEVVAAQTLSSLPLARLAALKLDVGKRHFSSLPWHGPGAAAGLLQAAPRSLQSLELRFQGRDPVWRAAEALALPAASLQQLTWLVFPPPIIPHLGRLPHLRHLAVWGISALSDLPDDERAELELRERAGLQVTFTRD